MSTPGFLELQLDPLVTQGSKGGLVYTTIVVSNPSRIETRFPQQSRGYWKMTINLTDKSRTEMATIQAHFVAVQGKNYGWRFRNFRDYQAPDPKMTTEFAEPLTLFAGGTTVQLSKARTYGGATEIVPIRKPDMYMTGFNLYLDGSTTPWPEAGNWSIDTTTGIITFANNMTGHSFAWQGEYDIPVRFDVDEPDISWDDFDVMGWEDIKVMEIQV
jgi:uncharacterized protein (TIGR02217 family)